MKNMLKAGTYPYWLKRRILGETGIYRTRVCEVNYDMAVRGTKHFILGHLSRSNNFPQLAFETTRNMLNDAHIQINKDVTLEVAEHDGIGNILYV